MDLAGLIAHREWVPADLSLADLVKRFKETPVSYLAVQDGRRVVGVVSREAIGLLFGGPYGFALFAADPVTSQMQPDFLAFPRSTSLLEVLGAALNREGPAFNTDVVLLDDSGVYLGMIPVHMLARLQSRLLEEHVRELEREKVQLRHNALHDALTDLPNRTLF